MSSSSSSGVQILSSSWTNTIEENKKFEHALIAYFFDESDPQRREKTDMMFPGKNLDEIKKHDMDLMIIDINNIEAGLIEPPAYHDDHHHHNYKPPPPSTERSEPKKYYLGRLSKTYIGTSNSTWWDEKEHRNFLQGLLECGKGEWAAISRNFVHTKTPMQVATHAQKYFLRLELKHGKSKKRSSIFDITTADIQ